MKIVNLMKINCLTGILLLILGISNQEEGSIGVQGNTFEEVASESCVYVEQSETDYRCEKLILPNMEEIDSVVQKDINENFSYSVDKPIVTFVFDDALQDIDLVASIFAEYNYPLCLAIIPDNLDQVCYGLAENSYGYIKGMTVNQVAKRVTQLGGEVLSHGYTVINSNNIDNIDVLNQVFVDNKNELIKNGFKVNGIILNGGASALTGGTREQGGFIMQYCARENFLYSDQYGITEQYYRPRIYLNKGTEKCIEDIKNAICEKKWIVFFGHSITGIYDEPYLTESHLRDILQYCKDNNVEVATYEYVYSIYGTYNNDIE